MNKSKVLLTMGFAVIGCLSAEASLRWKVLPCWGGGYIQGAALCPSDPMRMYTYVDVGGPYRSDDAGRNWIPLHANMPVEMRERGFSEVRSMSVDPRDADSVVILAGDDWEKPGGFAVTRDGGKTWRCTGTANVYGNGNMRCQGYCLSRNPFNPDELVGGEDRSGIFLSRDNGESWTLTGPTNVWYMDIRHDATVRGRVYASAPELSKATLAHCWCAGPSNGCTRDFGFFRSDDGGASWKRISSISPSEIAQIPGDERIVGIFSNRNIRVSSDGGVTWKPFEDGLFINPTHDGQPWAGGNYYALTAGKGFWLIGDGNGTMYRRGAGDAKWSRLPKAKMYAGDPANEPRMAGKNMIDTRMTALMTIVTDPKDDNHWLTTDWFELWETFDAGLTWTTRVRGIMQLVSYDIAFDPNSPDNICCCLYDMGAFVSTDGGVNFVRPEAVNAGKRQFPNNMATALYLQGRPGVVLGIGARGFDVGVWRSKDAGLTWEPTACRGLPPLVPGKSAASALVQDPRDGSILLAMSGKIAPNDGGVYRSRDEGDSWTWEGEGIETVKGFDYSLNHSQGAWPRIVVSPDGSALTGPKSGEWKLVSRNASEKQWKHHGLYAPTWRSYPIAADPCVPGRFLRGGDSATMESIDGGKTWHKYAPLAGKVCRSISFDRHNPGLVVFGCLDAIYVSTDGGSDLQPLDGGLNVPSGTSRKVILDRGRLYFLTSGSGVWHCNLDLAALKVAPTKEGKSLRYAWGDEFNYNGRPDPTKWDYEVGFVRNKEEQWYQPENAWCTNGYLVLEARYEHKPNPLFKPDASADDWVHNRTNIEMTSACVITLNKRSFTYGRIDIRAKIVAEGKLWPALWLLGDSLEDIGWPACGEIDILEYYNDAILANFIYGSNGWGHGPLAVHKPGKRVPCKENSSVRKLSRFLAKDPKWAEKWHVWSIERNEITTSIYLDGELMNVHVNELTRNPIGIKPEYPYRSPMYLLMNLAICQHDYDSKVPPKFPSQFLIDYVRVYE